MNLAERKLFRDPVHGNIHVEKWVCENFIDTNVFQRLRFIEQSSARLLFPGARHDRFIHSLGVFHIASKIFDGLKGELEKANIGADTIESLRKCFLIAALLHDCAHSPFSHTGEELAKLYCNSAIEDLLLHEIQSDSFTHDLKDADDRHRLHTHEMASAYVGAKVYSCQLEALHIDREQFARMIVGVINKSQTDSKEKMAYNCLIQLINGFVVDADRLDYLLRDTWATGICNTAVDVDRLIAGLEIDVSRGWVQFRAKALSCVVNAISARDYIYTWILPHHKVALANLLLNMSMKALVARLSKTSLETDGENALKNEAEVGALLFSPERLIPGKEVEIAHEKITLPSDGDLLYLMKKYVPDNSFVKAYFSREKTLVSLWKTYAEFSQIFSFQNEDDRRHLQEESFWNLFVSGIRKIEKEENFITTGLLKIKQTADDLHKVDVLGPDVREGDDTIRYQLDQIIPRDGRTKYYFYVYVWKSSAADAVSIKKRLRVLFETTMTDYRHM